MTNIIRPKNILWTVFLFFNTRFCFSQQQNSLQVNHKYSPPWWQTLIGMPDDPVKTLVGKEGQLFGDYGYREGPGRFSFSIQLDSPEGAVWESQKLYSAKVPLIQTIKNGNGIQIEENTFLQIPSDTQVSNIVRTDSRHTLTNWSKPLIECDSAFRDVAFGRIIGGQGLVEFHIKVVAGGSYRLALGFCEGEREEGGIRLMEIHAEGASKKEIDPVSDFGYRTPGIYMVEVKDLNHDGILNVFVKNAPQAKDRNVIINGIWLFRKNQSPTTASIISGKENNQCELYAPCASVNMPERVYHNLVKVRNKTSSKKIFQPVLRYAGIEQIDFHNQRVQVGRETTITSSIPLKNIHEDSVKKISIVMEPVSLNPGEEKELLITISRFNTTLPLTNSTIEDAKREKQKAIHWWQNNGPLSTPYIQLPDSGVQSMVESCIRNVFQARDIRGGLPSFNVGPTVYRGLWIADGTFILEMATMLNHIKEVRSTIDYLAGFQLPEGGFDMLGKFHKENGLVIYMIIRHAMLTQDKAWLNAHWDIIKGCIRYISKLRRETFTEPNAPYYGLLPPGAVDGGIGGVVNDYSNTEWCLSGMKWAIKAADWLGKQDDAREWEKEYRDFLESFIRSARKDLRQDDAGNTYLPVMIHNEKEFPPQKGQWAFCQSVYPGLLFDETPELRKMAEGTINMLRAHRQEGLVFNTGWMDQGLWNYFSSFYDHALQWIGKGDEIPQLLYDFANHSAPTMVWREEQKPQGMGNQEVGDMPHNWASAEFIRMVVHLIALDRNDELHLFEGLPRQWLYPGSKTRLSGILAPFGPVNLELTVNKNDKLANLNLEFADDQHLPSAIVIHNGYKKSQESKIAKPKQKIQMVLSLDN